MKLHWRKCSACKGARFIGRLRCSVCEGDGAVAANALTKDQKRAVDRLLLDIVLGVK